MDAPRDKKKLEKEALDRLALARRQKFPFEQDMREAYFFAAPNRARSVLSSQKISDQKPRDAGELSTSFAMECAGDFPTVMINTFLPQAQPWAMRRAGLDISEGARQDIDEQTRVGDEIIFSSINASNFYRECGKSFKPDLAIGNVGMWVELGGPAMPIACQAIPIREIEVNLGPFGEVDDRFVVRHTRNRHIKSVLPHIELPEKVTKAIEKNENGETVVVWGFWRDYKPDGDEHWCHTVLVGDTLVHNSDIHGRGSCPFIFGRFAPSPEFAWAAGPLIESLPEFRTIDETERAKIKNLDLTLQPPIHYPDDSFVNIEEGIEPGYGYPIRPGTGKDVGNIYEPHSQDAAIYNLENKEQRIKRMFFLDFPEQPGKTPPTATQWLDELTRNQQRIGTPGLAFYAEFCLGIFERYRYLLEAMGTIKPIEFKGKKVQLLPFNPAQRAVEQQDVAMAARCLEIVMPTFPEEAKVKIDGGATIDMFVKKMRVQDMIKMRPADQVAGAIDQIKQLVGGQAGAPPAIPSGAPPQVANPAGPAPTAPQIQVRGRS